MIEIPTPDGPMPAFSASPEGQPLGAVIVIQEAFGLTEHIGVVTEQVAAAGFRAIAPALFHRGHSPVLAYDDIESVRPVMGTLSAEGIATDIDAALAFLDAEGFEEGSIGMVGFCMGGSVTLFAATRPGLGAAVTYYGGGLSTGRFGFPPLIDIGDSIRCPWIGHFGDLDQGIPVEDVERLRAAAERAPAPTTIYRYASADHGFNCTDRPAVYNAEAASEAWERTISFFGSTLSR
jgi:carboxymethylenebutenolidase